MSMSQAARHLARRGHAFALWAAVLSPTMIARTRHSQSGSDRFCSSIESPLTKQESVKEKKERKRKKKKNKKGPKHEFFVLSRLNKITVSK
jgi:hypothetical protein